MSETSRSTPHVSPRTGLPIIPKGPPLPTGRCGESPPAALLRAVKQFNAREYWEAHETLEGLWRGEADPVRSLYQGVLLVGVGLHHLLRGNYHGATVKLRAGLQRLAPYQPTCQGLDVADLIAAATRCQAALEEAGPDGIAGLPDHLLPHIVLVPTVRP